jgi:hypothetical protein
MSKKDNVFSGKSAIGKNKEKQHVCQKQVIDVDSTMCPKLDVETKKILKTILTIPSLPLS